MRSGLTPTRPSAERSGGARRASRWLSRRVASPRERGRGAAARNYFRPLLIAVARLPCSSSPLNSQKNAPPRFCVLT
ncbi:hypothetical protein [Lysobacter gummosus]|uniref:hypothetical protein n=1 Tax=Lysobacter gummosus TaxID=262324 RepID=UPI003645438C